MTETASANGAVEDFDPSALADLRELHKKISGEHRKTLPVPGFRGRLCIRYRPPAWEESKKAAREAGSEETRADINAYARELVDACVGVFLREPGSGKLAQLTPGFGPELAEALEFEPMGSARGNIFALFGDPAPSDEPHDDNGAAVRLSAHHDVFLAWAAGRLDDDEDEGVLALADQEFLGE